MSGALTEVNTTTACFSISARPKPGKVQLTWTHLEGTERYDVYRAEDSSPDDFDKIGETTSTYSTYLDDTVQNETTYLYVVKAYVDSESCPSDVISSHPTSLRTRGTVNYSPVIYSSPVNDGTVGINYSYDVNATDPNGDVLSYSLLDSPADMEIDPISGLISWIPPEADSYDVTVQVADGNGLTDSQILTILVVSADNDGDGFTVLQGDCDDEDDQTFPDALELCHDLKDNDCDDLIDQDDGDCDVVECGDCFICEWTAPSSFEEFQYYWDQVWVEEELAYECVNPIASGEVVPPGSDIYYQTCGEHTEYGPCPPGYAFRCERVPVHEDCTVGIWGHLPELCPSPRCAIDDDADGYSEDEGDCDDTQFTINPAATEICDDGIDNNCDEMIDDSDDDCLALKFAPQLRFDGSAYNFPMSAQEYYDAVIATGRWQNPHWREKDYGPLHGRPQKDNRDIQTVTDNTAPTYFKVFRCGNQVRIVYWWFYGWQSECIDLGFVRFGQHNGDWERVMVALSEDTSRVAAVTYWQHGGWYTRVSDWDWHSCPQWSDCGFDTYGTHPIVYVGKNQHGSYHDEGGLGGCGYQYDFRNNGDRVDLRLDTWESLINLELMNEPWMTADAQGGFQWGYEGVWTHPTTNTGANCNMKACEGREEWAPLETNGCYLSQCRAGDRYAWPYCYHCPKNKVDWGAICVDDCSTYPFCPSRGIDTYGIKYPIPTGDAGLLYKYPGHL